MSLLELNSNLNANLQYERRFLPTFESFLALKNRMMTLHLRSMEDEHL